MGLFWGEGFLQHCLDVTASSLLAGAAASQLMLCRQKKPQSELNLEVVN